MALLGTEPGETRRDGVRDELAPVENGFSVI